MNRVAHIVAREDRETLWRPLQTFTVTRIVIVLVLLVYLGFNTVKGIGETGFHFDWETGIVYLMLSAVFALLSVYLQSRFMLQLLVQLTVDIVAITLLYIAAGGARSGLAILYLFPLAGCAILAPLLLALFFVSVVTLILLSESGYQVLHSMPDASPSRAGLYGAAFFSAIYVINRLAAKLIKQEELAARRGRELQLQEAVNRLVIADMGDGILVVGRDSEIFAANPSAERMLGLSLASRQPVVKLVEIPALVPIADAFFAWMERPSDAAGADAGAFTFLMIRPGDHLAENSGMAFDSRRDLFTHLKLRFVKATSEDLPEGRTVIFLQNVSEIESQAQQLKLASMGRLTASIAHEVRNPLSAISHAASLLNEDITHPTQSRLLKIVSDNVVRLNRMIEDILKLSRRAHVNHEPLQLGSLLAEIVDEFRDGHAVAPAVIDLAPMGNYQVRFDPLHLREVVLNLLSNAVRYASGRHGSIRVHALSPNAGRIELHVQDDGPAITPEVRSHLFEPFYTTSSKGTGLGLYLARELCLNNGAMLDYEYRMDMTSEGMDQPSGRFVITFALDNPLLP